MKYMKLGKTEIKVPRLCFGAMSIGGGILWQTDDKLAMEALERAFELGINYVDTAPVYGCGHSERLISSFLKGKRDKVILSTKGCLQWRTEDGTFEYEREGFKVYRTHRPGSLRQDLEDSLTRLETDYIDIYIIHRESLDAEPEEIMGELNLMKKEGKIRAIGLSNTSPEKLEEYLKYGEIALVQEKYSILSDEAKREYFPACERHGVTFQSYRSLEIGFLSGAITMDTKLKEGSAASTSPWAKHENRRKLWDMLDGMKPLCEKYNTSIGNLVLAHTLSQGNFMNVLFGSRSIKTVEQSSLAMDIILDKEDIAKMDRLASIAKIN